jgi:hypothetical protein
MDYKYPTLSTEYCNMGEVRNACNTLIRKPYTKRPLGRPGHKQNNKLNLSKFQKSSVIFIF